MILTVSPLFALMVFATLPSDFDGQKPSSTNENSFTWSKPSFTVTRTSNPPKWAGCKLAKKLRSDAQRISVLAYGLNTSLFEDAGFENITQIGPIISTVGTRDAIIALLEYDLVDHALIDSPQSLRPALETARKTIEAVTNEDFRLPSSTNSVLFGLYDTGVDLQHPAFIDINGESNVWSTWDQILDESCDRAELKAGSCTFFDVIGHGTSVTAIATNLSNENPGVARGAWVTAVKDDEFDELIPALMFFGQEAKQSDLPLIVNLSLAGHEGPHDGTSLESIAINSFPHLVVTAAGNEGDKSIHLSGELSANETMDAKFQIIPNLSEGIAEGIVEAWGTPNSDYWLGFAVTDSQGQTVATTGTVSLGAMGRTEELTEADSSSTILTVTLDAAQRVHPVTGKKQVRLTYKFSDLERWSRQQYKLVLRLGGRGEVDIWLDAPSSTPVLPKFEAILSPSTRHTLSVTNEVTISDIATSSMAIAVGSLINRNEIEIDGRTFQRGLDGMVGEVSKFSSYGPSKSPDRTGTKPDLVAPGEFVLTARSQQATNSLQLQADWTIMSGTSMAAPMVAGVGLLLLQFDPELTRNELRDRILSHTNSVADTTDPRIGRGLVSAKRASVGLYETPDANCGCRSTNTAPIQNRPLDIGLMLILLFRWKLSTRPKTAQDT